ncbi:hypothetical protein [Ornithinimicrobium sp. INDO-MA30-4]|uniref:hypothetical protein n=1 Tax=Ornithinimicrobium sp. INDO-MA30-4 TaxID=2908651 RepID=UPI001F26294E|nr:hypothetical protein [Ornithinimicrobium sp. INDO-MA30-4]UJH70605.1 hypothetical protein L0A91_00195 [Ornithinimicrobium sp. INDO-MA30-4]
MHGSSADQSPSEVVDVEIERLDRRWQQLPLDQALAAFPGLLAAVRQIAEETPWPVGLAARRQAVPDLGPAVAVDQLKVICADYTQVGGQPAWLAAHLTALRRSLP